MAFSDAGTSSHFSGKPTNRALCIFPAVAGYPSGCEEQRTFHKTGAELKIPGHPNVANVACAAIAITLLSGCNSLTRYPTEKEVAAAEDEIYEVVVRHITTPVSGQPRTTQLVFDDALLTRLEPEGDLESCKRRTRKEFSLGTGSSETGPPPYDSLADKVYRFFTRGDYDAPLRADTVQSFLERICSAPGQLSQTFHTDVPRNFIDPQTVHFNNDVIGPGNRRKSFEQLYPGANGIESFSHAGFDSTLDEAIVSTRFLCGFLCGGDFRYILRKKSGRWEIVNGRLVAMF